MQKWSRQHVIGSACITYKILLRGTVQWFFLALKISSYNNKLFMIWNHSIVPKIYWKSFRLQLMSCFWPKNHIFKLVDWTKIFTFLFLIFCAAYLLQEAECSLDSNNTFMPCCLLLPSVVVKRLIMSLFRLVPCLESPASSHLWTEVCSLSLDCSLSHPVRPGKSVKWFMCHSSTQ